MTARFDSDRSSGEDWGLQSVAPIDAASSLYLIGLFLDPGRFFYRVFTARRPLCLRVLVFFFAPEESFDAALDEISCR